MKAASGLQPASDKGVSRRLEIFILRSIWTVPISRETLGSIDDKPPYHGRHAVAGNVRDRECLGPVFGIVWRRAFRGQRDHQRRKSQRVRRGRRGNARNRAEPIRQHRANYRIRAICAGQSDGRSVCGRRFGRHRLRRSDARRNNGNRLCWRRFRYDRGQRGYRGVWCRRRPRCGWAGGRSRQCNQRQQQSSNPSADKATSWL